MSGLIRGVKKVFKAVTKVVKKVAAPLLAVGALVFTGGAALGLPGLLGGGWGAAAATVGQAIGGGGIVGSVLTGAITRAGQGALIGGAISALSGGSFSEGAKRGAAAGAITGGLGGAVSHLTRAVQPTVTPSGGPPIGPPQAGSTVVQDTPSPGMGGGTVPPRRGLLTGVGDWMKNNQDLVGNLISGVGEGMMADAAVDAERDLLRERHGLISANYEGTDPGRRYQSMAPGTAVTTPAERFSPDYYDSWEYQYDPKQGRVVRVPVQKG